VDDELCAGYSGRQGDGRKNSSSLPARGAISKVQGIILGASSELPRRVKTCAHCGRKNFNGAAFCEACGRVGSLGDGICASPGGHTEDGALARHSPTVPSDVVLLPSTFEHPCEDEAIRRLMHAATAEAVIAISYFIIFAVLTTLILSKWHQPEDRREWCVLIVSSAFLGAVLCVWVEAIVGAVSGRRSKSLFWARRSAGSSSRILSFNVWLCNLMVIAGRGSDVLPMTLADRAVLAPDKVKRLLVNFVSCLPFVCGILSFLVLVHADVGKGWALICPTAVWVLLSRLRTVAVRHVVPRVVPADDISRKFDAMLLRAKKARFRLGDMLVFQCGESLRSTAVEMCIDASELVIVDLSFPTGQLLQEAAWALRSGSPTKVLLLNGLSRLAAVDARPVLLPMEFVVENGLKSYLTNEADNHDLLTDGRGRCSVLLFNLERWKAEIERWFESQLWRNEPPRYMEENIEHLGPHSRELLCLLVRWMRDPMCCQKSAPGERR